MSASERSESPNKKRWATTAALAQSEVIAHLDDGNSDRIKMLSSMKDRKTQNSVTSIQFGTDQVNYQTDAAETQRRSLAASNPSDRIAQAARIVKMKADLTVTNFSLGDQIPLYETSTQRALTAAILKPGESRTMFNKDLKERAKKSSLHFGNESVDYKSCQQDAMTYRGDKDSFIALRDEVEAKRSILRKQNFSFGEEKVSYQTDYNRGYCGIDPASYRTRGNNKSHMKEVIEDSRKCHFSLGNDDVMYKSNTQAAQQDILGRKPGDALGSKENARKMKAALQKTSVEIGFDPEYV